LAEKGKRQPAREKHHGKKIKNAYSKLQVLLQKGGVMTMVM
jgi:hypothetical protein